MAIKFCPKCKNILIPERINEKEFLIKCKECGFSGMFKGKALIKREKIFNKKTGKKYLMIKMSLPLIKMNVKSAVMAKHRLLIWGFSILMRTI